MAKTRSPSKGQDPQQVLKDLLAKGKENGILYISEISRVLEKLELDLEAANKLYETLDELGIEIEANIDFNGLCEEQEFSPENVDDISKEELLNSSIIDDVSIADSIHMQLKEFGSVNLLTVEEELSLAYSIRYGKEAEERLNIEGDSLTPDERIQLEEVCKAGKKAREHLVEANLRLVASIAKRFVGKGMPYQDLMQEGSIGLIKAVEKFDPDKGFKFSTYATWWIRQAITRSIADFGRPIRIPVHRFEDINKVVYTKTRLLGELERMPTAKEIAAEINKPEEEVNELLKISQTTVSLETPVGEDDDGRLGDFIPDNSSNPDELSSSRMLNEQLVEVLRTLSPREEKIICLRYGIADGRSRTLEEVGKEFNVTRERIRQIENTALKKLRHPARAKLIQDFFV